MIHIYQIYFKEEQKKHLDKMSIPFDNSADTSREYEFGIMLKNYKKAFKSADYVGFLSWLFELKSKASVTSFVSMINEHPGYDVYLKDPYPYITNLYKNVWKQASCHPGLVPLAEKMFREVHNIEILNEIHESSRTTFCNYWVGNKSAFDKFMKFAKPIRQWMIDNNERLNNIFFDEYGKGLFPYIMERVIVSFLYNNKNIKVKGF